jgi:hypothetical protein
MHAIRVTLPARVAAAMAATALTAGGIMAAATVVSAAPKPKLDATRLSISNRAVAHGKHHVDAVTGVLSSDHKGVTGETVALEARTGVKAQVEGGRHRRDRHRRRDHLRRHPEGEDAVQVRLRG